jgi:anti-sigma28 factor (negative regulator of flagellin synthesis)
MKINPIANKNPVQSYRAGGAKPLLRDAALGHDEVVISADALRFSKLLAATRAEEPRTPAESARIAEVKDAVQRNEYRIDSGLVAEKILSGIQPK